jgi:large subunit ribosomal protein L35
MGLSAEDGFLADCRRRGLTQTTRIRIMPKIKTKKSATKKFKMSATGKAMRTQAGKRHLNGYKTRGRKRNLRGSAAVYEGNQKMVARMLQA